MYLGFKKWVVVNLWRKSSRGYSGDEGERGGIIEVEAKW